MNTLFLPKLLPTSVSAILVGAVSAVFLRRIGRVVLGFALVALWLPATPAFANWLNWQLESQFPPVNMEMLPQSDVVILLGGVGGQPLPPRMIRAVRIYRARKAPLVLDGVGGEPLPPRLMHAVRIYRAGKAPLIAICAESLSEAQLNADRLVKFGAPRSALILETESRNTRENAVNIAAIFKEHGWRTGLLVTSGVHMPRALAAFKKMAVSVTPAATDIHARPVPSLQFVSLVDLLPDAEALNATTLAIKEMIGLYIYRYRGWA